MPKAEPAREPRRLSKPGIPAKKLVAPQTRERRGHTTRFCVLANVIRVDRIARWLIEAGENFIEIGGHFATGKDVSVMLRPKVLSRVRRFIRFRIGGLFKTDGERF